MNKATLGICLLQCCMLGQCTGFGWDGVHRLHSSLYRAMFWICAESSVGSTLMFQSLLSRACTAPRPVLRLTLPRQRAGWECTGGWEGTQPGQLTQL